MGPVYKEFQSSPCLLYPEQPPSTCTLPPSPPTPLTTPPFLPCHHPHIQVAKICQHYQLQLTANLPQAHVHGPGLTIGRNLPPLSPIFALTSHKPISTQTHYEHQTLTQHKLTRGVLVPPRRKTFFYQTATRDLVAILAAVLWVMLHSVPPTRETDHLGAFLGLHTPSHGR